MAHDAQDALSSGASQSRLIRHTLLIRYYFASILRAFLVEEAKIVKKVIKSQAKPARK